MQKVLSLCFLAAFVASAGCGLELNKSSEEKRTASGVGGVLMGDPMSPDPVKTPAVEPAPVANAPAVAPTESPAVEAAPATPPVAPASEAPAQPDVVREKAAAGAGKKGNYEGSGMVVTPIKAYFRAKERIAFEIQIPHAMNLYKATNVRFPKDMDEFTAEILEPNQVKLPALPKGHKYVYDAAKGELQVEHPPK